MRVGRGSGQVYLAGCDPLLTVSSFSMYPSMTWYGTHWWVGKTSDRWYDFSLVWTAETGGLKVENVQESLSGFLTAGWLGTAGISVNDTLRVSPSRRENRKFYPLRGTCHWNDKRRE